MEILLVHAFDYISSTNPQKIHKGLRQIEGLLAKFCLYSSPPIRRVKSDGAAPRKKRRRACSDEPSMQKHIASRTTKEKATRELQSAKSLDDLNGDGAFLEFSRLQDSFKWNCETVPCPFYLIHMCWRYTNSAL